jgi:hypothetical protein
MLSDIISFNCHLLNSAFVSSFYFAEAVLAGLMCRKYASSQLFVRDWLRVIRAPAGRVMGSESDRWFRIPV